MSVINAIIDIIIHYEGNYKIIEIAIEGCLHGELADVYRHVEDMEEKLGLKFDALIVCGDFQSLRH